MADRAGPSNSEIDRSTSPVAKKSKLDEQKTPNEPSLETSEVLPSSDESSCEEDDEERPSTAENSSAAEASSSFATQQQPSQTMVREICVGETTSLMGKNASYYQELLLIGDGAYGTVYKARDSATGNVVALKKVRVAITGDGLPASTLRELSALKQLDQFENPQIVKLIDVCQGNYQQFVTDDGKTKRIDSGVMIWMVFEHIERDLASFLNACRSRPVPPQLIKQMSREILLGVDFLHTHRIVHRDLKPQNLLVTTDGHVKIADFGLAKTYDFVMRLTSVVVTLWYRAPEVLLGCPYASPVDLWSVGCILAELNERKPLLPGTSEGDQLDKIFRIIGTPPKSEWPKNVSLSWSAFPYRHPTPMQSVIPNLCDSGIDLVQKMLTFNPHNRITAAQALQHPYLIEDDQPR